MDQPSSSGSKGGMDMSKLSTGDMITGGGAIAYLLSVFIFNWYTVSIAGIGSAGATGRGGITYLAILAAIAAIVEIGVRVFAGNTLIPNYKQVHMGLAIAALVITALRIFLKPSVGILTGVDVGISFGIFVSLILAAVWTFGAVTMKGETGSAPAAPMGGGDTPIA
ncbi:MAG: hypothetical protein QOE25_583 [Actinomycetota bacterium]|nr:hypothetical protein [Actinomycetota bacterium]